MQCQTIPTISADVLKNTKQIEYAVKTYFQTLCNKYDRQIDPKGAKAVAYDKRTRRSGDRSRKGTKYNRRFDAVSKFEIKHHVKDVGLLVREELMSSEEEDCGLVAQDVWSARAANYSAKGQKALEIHKLECRSVEVSDQAIINGYTKLNTCLRSAACTMPWICWLSLQWITRLVRK